MKIPPCCCNRELSGFGLDECVLAVSNDSTRINVYNLLCGLYKYFQYTQNGGERYMRIDDEHKIGDNSGVRNIEHCSRAFADAFYAYMFEQNTDTNLLGCGEVNKLLENNSYNFGGISDFRCEIPFWAYDHLKICMHQANDHRMRWHRSDNIFDVLIYGYGNEPFEDHSSDHMEIHDLDVSEIAKGLEQYYSAKLTMIHF